MAVCLGLIIQWWGVKMCVLAHMLEIRPYAFVSAYLHNSVWGILSRKCAKAVLWITWKGEKMDDFMQKDCNIFSTVGTINRGPWLHGKASAIKVLPSVWSDLSRNISKLRKASYCFTFGFCPNCACLQHFKGQSEQVRRQSYTTEVT